MRGWIDGGGGPGVSVGAGVGWMMKMEGEWECYIEAG